MRKGFQMRGGASSRWANFIKNPNQETNKRTLDPKKVYVAATHQYQENPNDFILSQELFADEQPDQYLKVTEVSKQRSWIVKLTNPNPNQESLKNLQSISVIRTLTDQHQVDYDIGFKVNIMVKALDSIQ